jgi:ribosomal protein L11 methyltransferase
MPNSNWVRAVYHGPNIGKLRQIIDRSDHLSGVVTGDGLEIYAPDPGYLRQFLDNCGISGDIRPVQTPVQQSIEPFYQPPFFICPDGFDGFIPDGAIPIYLGDDLAFGDGRHPTTAQCLAMIRDLPGMPSSFLDFGCGSGVLAMAMAKYHEIPGMAIDCDAAAIRATRRNLKLNCIGNVNCAKIEQTVSWPYDVILANILANPLMTLADQLVDQLAPGGNIILSGMLYHQSDRVLSRYRDLGLRRMDQQIQDNWVTLCLQKMN